MSANREEVARIEYGEPVQGIAFSPDGRWLAGWSDLAGVRLIEMANGREVASITDLASMPTNVVFSPDGHWLAVLGQGGSSLIDTTSGKRVLNFGTFSGLAEYIAFSSDSRFLASVSDAVFSAGARYVRVIETASGNEIVRQIYYQGVNAIALSPDGQLLAVGAPGGELIEITSGTERARFGALPASIAFSPDGRLLAVGSSATIGLIETASGREVARIPHQGAVLTIAFSPNGRLLATGSEGSARLIELATGTEVIRIAHEGEVRTVAFSPDGRWLKTNSLNHPVNSRDRTVGFIEAVRLIETATGREMDRIVMDRMARSNGERAADFSPNGQLLATASTTGTAPEVQFTIRLLRVNL